MQRRVVALRHEARRARVENGEESSATEQAAADQQQAAAAEAATPAPTAAAKPGQSKTGQAFEYGGPQRNGPSEALPPNFSHAQLKVHESAERPTHENVWAVHNNAMRFLPNFFDKGQLMKLFFCFPDPHFKRKNHRKRIISTPLLAEFAYVIRPAGLIYLITDVSELMEWMVCALSRPCPLDADLDAEGGTASRSTWSWALIERSSK